MFYTKVFNTKSKLYHIGYNEEGKFIKEEDFKPHLGIISNNNPTHTTIYNDPVELKYFDDVKEFNTYKKSYKDMFKLFDDIDPAYQFISETYPDKVEYDLEKIKVVFFDIETSPDPETGNYSPPHEANGPITSIALKDIYKQNIFVLSTEKFYPEQMEIEVTGKVHYKFCYTEAELLKTFVKLVDKLKVDILSGYFSDGFDIPYTINRCYKVIGDFTKHLSPIRGKVESVYNQDENGVDSYRNTIEGISLVDFMLLYQKNIGKYESNSLSFVAGVELGEDKVNYEEYDNLEELRLNNPQKFLEYNIIDVELLDKINKKRKLIELVIAVAYFSKSNFDDITSPIKTWDNFIYNYLSKQNIAIPPRTSKVKEDFHIPGGYVKTDVIPGVYKNVITLDLKSLYPSLAITLNISPDTIIDEGNEKVDLKKIDKAFLTKEIVHQEDTILTGSGWKYTKDKQGFYPALFQFLLDTRDVVKQNKLKLDKKIQKFKGTEEEKLKLTNEYSNLHTFEQAVKLLANSGYGILGNKHCRYYDPRLAASITLSGQLAIKTASNVVEKFIKKKFGKEKINLFTHTDSAVICLDGVVDNIEDIDNFVKENLAQLIKDSYSNLCVYLNVYKNLLIMKREKICSHFLISAPSRYACLVVDKEGVRYEKPKLEITGMEIVRSSTPKIIKPYLKESLIKMMKEDNVADYIEEVKSQFYKMKPEEISFPRSANNLSKWVDSKGNFVSGCPIGVRAAHVYNNFIDQHGITDYNKITEGTKIKFCYLKQPNPMFNSHVVGFIRRFLGDGTLDEYVDYKTQFDKVYLNVITDIAGKVGFDLDKDKKSLEDMF